LITIKIEIPAITELASALHVLANASYETALVLKSGKPEPTKTEIAATKEEKTTKPRVDTAPEEKKLAPEAITLEQVRARLAALTQSGKQAEVKALITKYGAEKLSDIPKGKYPELLRDAEGI